MDFQKFLTNVLEDASTIAVKNFGKVSGVTKGPDNNQVLTETDLEIGSFLIEKIKKVYPGYNIIDEEVGIIDNHSEFTWVVDPIDGTSNFASGVPTYGIMLGLLQNQTPIAGGIALPSFHTIAIAERGKGTMQNDQRISVTKEKSLLNCLVSYEIDGHQEDPAFTRNESTLLGEIILSIRNLRTSNSCYDAVMVASGNYGAVLNQTSKIWDNVAMQIVIEEAGGVYTDFFGNPIDYSDPVTKIANNFTMCAAPFGLHQQLQKIIHEKKV